MLKHLFLLTSAILIFFIPAEAQKIRYGIGGILFDPTGVWGSYRLGKGREIDLALAMDSDLHVQGAYIISQPPLEIELVPVPWYYGIGLRIKSKDGVMSMGPRGVVGLKHRLKNTKVVFFGETGLVIDIFGDTGFHAGIGVGARYYF